MRYSFSLAVLAAIGAQAMPQESVQPITQISDGQIQAPPATSVPAVPSVSVPVVPSEAPSAPGSVSVPVEVSSVIASITGVVPSSGVPVPTEVTSVTVPVVVPIPTGPAGNSTGVPTEPSAPANGTVSTGAPSSTGGGESGSPTESGDVPSDTGSAAMANMVSVGGLVFAVAGALFV